MPVPPGHAKAVAGQSGKLSQAFNAKLPVKSLDRAFAAHHDFLRIISRARLRQHGLPRGFHARDNVTLIGFLLRQQCPDKERLWLLWLVLNFGYDIKELMGCYDQRIKPFRGEVSQIARHEIVGAGSLCTLQKNIVVRIGADLALCGRL